MSRTGRTGLTQPSSFILQPSRRRGFQTGQQRHDPAEILGTVQASGPSGEKHPQPRRSSSREGLGVDDLDRRDLDRIRPLLVALGREEAVVAAVAHLVDNEGLGRRRAAGPAGRNSASAAETPTYSSSVGLPA